MGLGPLHRFHMCLWQLTLSIQEGAIEIKGKQAWCEARSLPTDWSAEPESIILSCMLHTQNAFYGLRMFWAIAYQGTAETDQSLVVQPDAN